jgi:hypothetical protein
MRTHTGDLYLDVLSLSLDFADNRLKISVEKYPGYLNKYCEELKKLLKEAK